MPETENRKVKLIIKILSVLLACTLLACALTILRIKTDHAARTSTASDNYLSPSGSTASLPEADRIYLLSLTTPTLTQLASTTGITLKASNPSSSETFTITDMLPGDSVTKQFTVTVKDKTATAVAFDINISSGSHLSEVLQVTVAESGKTLYEGTLRDLAAKTLSLGLTTGTTSKLTYSITVSMPTSVGNEYQGQALYAAFKWTLSEDPGGSGTTPSSPTTSPSAPTSSISSVTTTTEPSPETSKTTSRTTKKTTTSEPTPTAPEPTETTSAIGSGTTPIETTPPAVTVTVAPLETSTEPPIETTEITETSTVPPETTTTPVTSTTPPAEDGCHCKLNLPWCGEETCHCPWCWLIPLLLIVAACVVTAWLIYRKYEEKKKKQAIQGGDPHVGM